MALLEIRDLHTYYGKIHALRGVSLTVDEGEIVTIGRDQAVGLSDPAREIVDREIDGIIARGKSPGCVSA